MHIYAVLIQCQHQESGKAEDHADAPVRAYRTQLTGFYAYLRKSVHNRQSLLTSQLLNDHRFRRLTYSIVATCQILSCLLGHSYHLVV